MVVLQGFVDDSGSTDGNIFALSGFLSTADRWQEFSDEWEAICNREPKMPDFKMTKARQGVGPRYSNAQLNERIRELTALTIRKSMYRITSTTARPNYERIVKGQVPKDIDSIYFVLFFNVILATARLMEIEQLEGTVDFIFDEQGGSIESECVRWYRWIKSHPLVSLNVKKRLGSTPIFRDDNKVLPLKAADMSAWHIRRHLNEEQPQGISAGEYLQSIEKIFGFHCILQPEDLASLVYAVKRGLTFQSHCQFFLPNTGAGRGRLLE